MLIKFVWQYKKPRVRFATLSRPRELGGLALPNYYYEAVSLLKILKHYSSSYLADWKFTEDTGFYPKNFWEILWMHPKC